MPPGPPNRVSAAWWFALQRRNNGSNWLNQYFADPQVATTPEAFTVGNAPREISSVHAPGTATTALSLFKQFHLDFLREGSFLEFRAEAFNICFTGPALPF
jgi:hypothetical protein